MKKKRERDAGDVREEMFARIAGARAVLDGRKHEDADDVKAFMAIFHPEMDSMEIVKSISAERKRASR